MSPQDKLLLFSFNSFILFFDIIKDRKDKAGAVLAKEAVTFGAVHKSLTEEISGRKISFFNSIGLK